MKICSLLTEKCVHGLLIRGWFNIEQLKNNAGFMSTGVNGIDLEYNGGQLRAVADTQYRRWETTAEINERDWQFLEVSYHPKSGLSLYVDEVSYFS